MLSLTATRLISNPGQFTPIEPNGWLFAAALTGVILGGAFPFFVMFARRWISGTWNDFSTWSMVVGAAIAVVGLGLFVVAGLTPTGRPEYRTQVVEWLQEDYGIDVDTAIAARLLDGERITVDVDGKRTAITVLSGADRNLDVLDGPGNVIEPRS